MDLPNDCEFGLCFLLSEQRSDTLSFPRGVFGTSFGPRQHPTFHGESGNVGGAQQRGQVWSPLARPQELHSVGSELAYEYFALNAMPQNVLVDAKGSERGSCRAQTPVGALSKPIEIGIGMPDLPEIGAQVPEEVVRYVEVSPSPRVANRSEILRPTKLQPIVHRGSAKGRG